MFINEINIFSFGKLENEIFRFENGLNLIYGSNESGKSTIMAFVRFIFYGMKSHKSGGELSFKEKFMPWSGKAASGSLTLTDEIGNCYVISRVYSDTQNRISVINALTGEEEKSIDLKKLGNYFLGVNDDTFCQTAFLSGLTSVVKSDRDGELLKRLANISQSGNEKISFANAETQIQEKIAELSSPRRKNAVIPTLRNNISVLCNDIKMLVAEAEKQDEIEEKIEEYRIKLVNYKTQKRTKEQVSNDAGMLESQIKNEIEVLEKSDFMRFKTTTSEEKEIISTFLAKDSTGRFLRGLLVSIFLLISGLMGLINTFLYVFSFVGFLGLIFCFCFKAKERSFSKKAMAILEKYDCKTYAEFNNGVKAYEDICIKISILRDELSKLQLKVNNTSKAIKSKNNFTSREIDDKIDSVSDEGDKLLKCIYACEEKLELCRQAEFRLKELNAEKQMLEEKLSIAERKLVVLNLSYDILKKAHYELKREFAPQLAEATSEILSKITSGKYGNLLADDDFSIKLKSDFKFNDSRFYSRGTYEQIYFSMRIALLNIAVQDKILPLFLDDAFGFYDDDRFLNVLKLVYDESKKRQVFISSCRAEEYIFFRNQGVNIIELHSERND